MTPRGYYHLKLDFFDYFLNFYFNLIRFHIDRVKYDYKLRKSTVQSLMDDI